MLRRYFTFSRRLLTLYKHLLSQNRWAKLCFIVIGLNALLPGFVFTTQVQGRGLPGYNGNIVFSTNRDANEEIYSMDADGANQVRLTSVVADDFHPVWSPDGSKVLFVSMRDGGDREIYVMDADGTNQTRLTNSLGLEVQQAWSPDGSRIVFASSRDGNYEIYVMDADGSNQTRLTNASGNDLKPQWSPDGSRITFISMRTGNWEIYVMDADGTGLTNLSANPSGDLSPMWTPDGNSIVFISTRDGNQEIYKMDADGSNQTRLTSTPNSDEDYLDISTDGSKLAFLRYNLAWDHTSLVTSNIDGSNQNEFDFSSQGIQIIDGGQDLWSPDGSKILLIGCPDTNWNDWDQFIVNSDGTNLTKVTTDGLSSYGHWFSVPNTAPIAVNDSLTTSFNTAGSADVIANDTDEEALDSQYLTISTQPLNGTSEVVAGKVEYTPNDGFNGSDQLSYQICDAFTLDQKCSTGVLAITVQAPGAPTLTVSTVGGSEFNSSTNKYSTSNKRPTFSGTASPGAEIKVEIHSDPILLTTTSSSDGEWTVAPTSDLPAGEHTVYISATMNGVTTQLDPFVLAVTDEAEIPATGATTWPLQVGGMVLIVVGGGLGYWQRRQLRILYTKVPALWP